MLKLQIGSEFDFCGRRVRVEGFSAKHIYIYVIGHNLHTSIEIAAYHRITGQ